MGVICDNCMRNNSNNRTVQKQQNKINLNLDGCYTCKAEIIQKPEIGRDDFTIKISAQHHGDHSCDEQILFIVFNYPTNFISCSNGNLISNNNTTRLRIKLAYHNNPNDHIEIGDFKIKCAYNDLEVVSCSMTDNH